MGFVSKIFAQLSKMISPKSFDGEAAATLSMRWARPMFFILMTIMLVIGWWKPDAMGVYFEAMTKAPEWLTQIFTILILGLAVEKGIARPIKETMALIKGASPDEPTEN